MQEKYFVGKNPTLNSEDETSRLWGFSQNHRLAILIREHPSSAISVIRYLPEDEDNE